MFPFTPKPVESRVDPKERPAISSTQRVVIIGSSGQLGTDLVEAFQSHEAYEVLPLTRPQADCTDAGSVRKAVLRLRPSLVINCAGFVQVDECEDQPQHAFAINALGALHVARACAAADSMCVHISTDYVFDGSKADYYVESDSAYPVNVYGASKLAGEILVRQTVPRWLIIRAASLFGRTGARSKGGNFVETILAKAKMREPLRIVNDVRMSPTYTRDAAMALVGLVEAGTNGIVHLTNDGACTWYEFAQQILGLVGLRVSIDPVSSKEYPTTARRPKNCVLQSERSLVKLRSWKDALKAYLIEKGHMTAS
jgi:dTDP-4-dehydrorhamnose reductase